MTLHFALRGRKENYDLRKTLQRMKMAERIVAFADSNPMKIRKSAIKPLRRMVILRVVAASGEGCPV